MPLFHMVQLWHKNAFDQLNHIAGDWLLGLSARLIFSSVLFFYFFNSAMTKVGGGLFGIFSPTIGAYAQIIPPVVEAVDYDLGQIGFFPWTPIVVLGTLAELLLPILILLGLATRLASIAFIGFIMVMSFVDIQFHGVEAITIGSLFDSIHNSEILDQRLLWLMPLITIIFRGSGKVSLDHLITRSLSGKKGSMEQAPILS